MVELFAGVIATAMAPAAGAQCGVVVQGAYSNQYTNTLSALPGGGMLVGGDFTLVGGVTPAMHVAIWNNGTWTTLGSGVGGPAMSSVVMPNGDLVVGGEFQVAGGQPANSIARWDGSAWHALGSGFTSPSGPAWVYHMVVMPNGDLVVAGSFYSPVPRLARWNGSTWSSIGGGGWDSTGGLAVAPNGDLFVAYNQTGGARVMRWDGSAWSQIGSGSSAWRVYSLCVTPAGGLIAGGLQPPIAAWSGSTWTTILGSFPSPNWPQVYALERLPNGDLAAALHTSPNTEIWRWNGSSWQTIALATSPSPTASLVLDLALLANGHLALCGLFGMVNVVPAGNVGTLSSTCPANAISYGSGCPGSAGLVSLMATQWPMLGGVARGRTTGLTANSLAVGVFGFSQINVPLSSGHPLGLPGCNVLVADNILIQFLVGNGVVESFIGVPSVTSLIGASFHHQVVPVELAASGSIQALTSSNALTLTIGSF